MNRIFDCRKVLSITLLGFVFLVGQSLSTNAAPDLTLGGIFYAPKVQSGLIRYAAVGDSYTCGTGATSDQAWPSVLAKDLQKRGIMVALALNTGVDGWTTKQALNIEMPTFKSAHPQFASLMIGVNDTYQPTTPDQFHHTLNLLLNEMQKALPNPNRMFMVTIPNFTVTQRGAEFASVNNASAKISIFNSIIENEGKKRHIPVVDVYALSQQLSVKPDMVASDQLHPSAKQYAIWESKILPVAYKILNTAR